MRRTFWMAALLLLLPGLTAAQAQSDGGTRLLRYPDICGNTVAFVYGGDIWLVDAGGGVARRLTSGEGDELVPKFSPDCRSIAFTGQYTGTRQVYVIPVGGGSPASSRSTTTSAPSRRAAASTTRSWAGRRTARKSSSTPTARPTASATRGPT